MQTQKINSAELRADLAQHTGISQWYRHGLNRKLLLTEGALDFAQKAGGFWFIDIIAFEVFQLQKTEEFLAICLDVREGAADIRVTDGNENPLYKRKIHFTDCPTGQWFFYLNNNVLMLPSEY